jgi:hypothetical protein
MKRDVALTVSRALAWIIGVAVPVGETVRRWGVWGYPPSWLDDFFVGAFLLVAAWRAGRDPKGGRAWLAGAWCFGAGVFYCSFFGHLRDIDKPVDSTIPHLPLTILIGLAFAIMVAATALTLFGARSRG